MIRSAFPLLVLLLASAPSAVAEIVPLGEPIDVADTDLYSFESRPRICAGSAAPFAVSWWSATTTVMARTFDRDGSPLMEPREILDTRLSNDSPAEIACLPSGAFVAVWTRATETYGRVHLMARVFGADGTPQGPPVRVDQTGLQIQNRRVACGDSGCVVVWVEESTETYEDFVRARRLGPDGKPKGDEILVALGLFDQGDAAVAVAPDGSFSVSYTWSIDAEVGLRRFRADGSADGPATTLVPFDGFANGFLFSAVARSPEGADLVVWAENPDFTGVVLYYSVVRPDGSLAVNRATLDPAMTYREPTYPLAVPDAGGGFVVIWADTDQRRVVGRRLTSAGAFRGPIQDLAGPVLMHPLGEPEYSVASRPDGTLALTWQEWNPYGFNETRVRLFRTSAPPPPSTTWLSTAEVPGFQFQVRFSTPNGSLLGAREPGCIEETLCVSGALPGRSEVFARVVGPKPNGFLWPTLVKFSTSQVEIWVRQDAAGPTSGEVRYYVLDGARPGFDELPGLFDRTGFEPIGAAVTARLDGLFAAEPQVVASGSLPVIPGGVPVFTSNELPDFRFGVRIVAAGQAQEVRQESDCIEETLCLSGAIPGRSEIFVRVVGPKPNGKLWPTLVKFTTSEVQVWVEQVSTGETRSYVLPGAAPGRDDLTGLFDREGFTP